MVEAREDLERQLTLLGARDTLLSTNVALTLNGVPRSHQPRSADPGAAIYFKLNGRDTVLACDKWRRVEDNIVAIAKHIEALRGQERWGVGSLEQAFTGYAALPAPVARRHWTSVLGVTENASLDTIQGAYRTAAKTAGTDQDRLYELNMARDEAVAARSLT